MNWVTIQKSIDQCRIQEFALALFKKFRERNVFGKVLVRNTQKNFVRLIYWLLTHFIWIFCEKVNLTKFLQKLVGGKFLIYNTWKKLKWDIICILQHTVNKLCKYIYGKLLTVFWLKFRESYVFQVKKLQCRKVL